MLELGEADQRSMASKDRPRTPSTATSTLFGTKNQHFAGAADPSGILAQPFGAVGFRHGDLSPTHLEDHPGGDRVEAVLRQKDRVQEFVFSLHLGFGGRRVQNGPSARQRPGSHQRQDQHHGNDAHVGQGKTGERIAPPVAMGAGTGCRRGWHGHSAEQSFAPLLGVAGVIRGRSERAPA